MRLGLLSVLLLLGACFAPNLDFQNGALGCDNGGCPPGFDCRDLRCWRAGTGPGIPDAAAGGSDGGAVCSGSERSCASPTQPRHCEAGAWVNEPVCAAAAPFCDGGTCQAGCTAPAVRCRDNRTPEACNPSGTWDPQPMCMFACTGNGECTGVCVPNDKECRNGNELWQCGQDGTWGQIETCASVCENASCGGDCTADQKRCSPTAPKVPQTCNGGHWQDQAPCAYACLSDGTCAQDCDPAGPGACIGGDAYQCDATGHYVLHEHCTTNCSGGACSGLCHDGDKQCAGTGNRTPQTCMSGSWVDGTPCEFVCDQGSCIVTECHPNVDKKCELGIPYSCDATGHWVAGTACAFVCDGNQCGGICRPGDFRCNGTTNLEKCAPDGKSWALDHACPFGCSNNQCNACTPDTMANTCQGKCGTVTNNCGTPVDCGDTCAATHGANWSCGASHTCECTRNITADCSGKCGTITDRCGLSVDCSAAGNGGLACNAAGQVCKADHSCCTQEPIGTTCSGDPGDDCGATVPNNCGVEVACPTACDSGFTCGGNPATPAKCSCMPGAVRCVGSTSQTCNGGLSWGGDMSCAVACIDGVGCGMCTPTTTQCFDSTHVTTCQANGTFGFPTVCPANAPACRPSTGSCGGVCVPGSQMCGTDPVGGGPAVLKCDAEGQWTIVVMDCAFTCTGGSTSPACTGSCQPNATRCMGDTLQTCGPDFNWNTGTNCGSTKHCGTKNGVSTCCTETDTDMCPGTGGSPCNNVTRTKTCGYVVTCTAATCQPGYSCNTFIPNVCAACDPSHYTPPPCFETACDQNGNVVAGAGCNTQCCCVDESSGDEACTSMINCPVSDGTHECIPQ